MPIERQYKATCDECKVTTTVLTMHSVVDARRELERGAGWRLVYPGPILRCPDCQDAARKRHHNFLNLVADAASVRD